MDEKLENLIFGEENNDFLNLVREKLQRFISVLNNHNNTYIYDYSLPYSDYYKTFYIALGTKFSANDETTLLACTLNEADNALEVISPLLEDDENTIVLIDNDFETNFASILRNLLKEKIVKEKLYIYSRLYSKDKFLMTIFAHERFLYVPDNKQFFLNREDVKKLKAGDVIALPKNLLESWNQVSDYEGEVNGIIALVKYENGNWTACVNKYVAG